MAAKNKNIKNKTSKKTNKRMKKTGNKRMKKTKTLRKKKMIGGTTSTHDFATTNQVGKLYNDMNFQKANMFEINPNPLSNLA